MSLAVVGAALLVLCILAYAMSHSTDSPVDLHNPKVFQERKDLYRKQRDDFKSNSRAMKELKHWKAKDNDYDYVELYVPPMCPCGRDPPGSSELQNASESLKLSPEVYETLIVPCLFTVHLE